MIEIDDIHREALEWFDARSGEIVPWPEALPNGQRLATQAKGIYKPGGWVHALSIKIIPSGRYPDEEPQDLGDGRWQFRYHQEDPSNADATTYYTNRGLAQCLADQVPIGVLRQTRPKPGPQYEVRFGRVTKWEGGFFTIEGPAELAAEKQPHAVVDANESATSIEDARDRTITEITRRRGQAAFRSRLLTAYGGCCAISGCAVEAVLEAAHIVPYRGAHTNEVSNGLLLRADLHTLFDLNFLQIDADTLTVRLDPSLLNSEYGALDRQSLRLPLNPTNQPVPENFRLRTTVLAAP